MGLRWMAFGLGIVIVLGTWVSLLHTLIVPRGLSSRLSELTRSTVRWGFLRLASMFRTYEGKDGVLTHQGPTELLAILIVWLALFFLGYALIFWPLIHGSFGEALRLAGSSFFTLGFAARPDASATAVAFVAAATGPLVVALQIAYLPVLYQAFNRRETLVTVLESRAGAPAAGPEILARHHAVGLLDNLPALYSEWERWAAEVAESHTTYPVLIDFRSPNALRSWIVALLAVLDSAAIYNALCPDTAPSEARLCLRMGFTCLRNIADVSRIHYDPDPMPDTPIGVSFEEFMTGTERMRAIGFESERSYEDAYDHFRGWRVNYESIAYQLADRLVAVPGLWTGPRRHARGITIAPRVPTDRKPGDLEGKTRINIGKRQRATRRDGR